MTKHGSCCKLTIEMPIRVGVGSSENSDAYLAGQEAGRIASQKALEDFFDLVIVFASAKFNQHKLLQGVQSVCHDANIVGCSTAGEITTEGLGQNSVALMGLKGSSLAFSTGLGPGLSHDGRSAGQKCAQEAVRVRIRKRHAFMLFSDGLSGNGSDAIKGAQEVLGTSFPIVGGLSGDDYLFETTYQYHNGKPFNDAAVGILLGGQISVGIGVRHGWHTIGKAHQVTKAHANVIESIDNKPAFGLYQDYFGQEAQALKTLTWAKLATSYPLGMSIADEDECIIRYAHKARADGSLVCAAEVPQGSQVRLMIADKAGILHATHEATAKALENINIDKLSAIIVFDSIARKRILGHSAKEELAVIKKVVGKEVPIIGFYSYGEQAPLQAQRYSGRSYLHNETIVVMAIAEETNKW